MKITSFVLLKPYPLATVVGGTIALATTHDLHGLWAVANAATTGIFTGLGATWGALPWLNLIEVIKPSGVDLSDDETRRNLVREKPLIYGAAHLAGILGTIAGAAWLYNIAAPDVHKRVFQAAQAEASQNQIDNAKQPFRVSGNTVYLSKPILNLKQ